MNWKWFYPFERLNVLLWPNMVQHKFRCTVSVRGKRKGRGEGLRLKYPSSCTGRSTPKPQRTQSDKRYTQSTEVRQAHVFVCVCGQMGAAGAWLSDQCGKEQRERTQAKRAFMDAQPKEREYIEEGGWCHAGLRRPGTPIYPEEYCYEM